MTGLEDRWQRRWGQRSTRDVRLERAIELHHSPDRVWALIAPPESALELAPETTARAFRVTGTPDGVGEQQCFVDHTGNAEVVEVVELIPGRRAVTRTVSPADPVDMRSIYEVTAGPTGCRLTYGTVLRVPAGTHVAPTGAADWHRWARTYLTRVEAALDRRHPPAAEPTDAWSVPLDDAFIAAAPVREQPGALRAAAAQRISTAHDSAEPWRSPPPALPARRRRSPARFLALPAALAATAVAVLGTGELLERLPGPTPRLASPVGDGTPLVPRPDDAQTTRLAPPAPPPAGEGGWVALAQHAGRPVAFDPCRPVHWVMNGSGAPADALPLLHEAFGHLSQATGLVFAYDGPTDERDDERRPLVQPERYGDRYAPVLVAWSDGQATPGLAGDVAGMAGPATADPDGAGPRYVSGSVVLDAPDLGLLPGGRPAVLGVVLHELGHLVGLGHVDDPADLMHASSDPTSGFTPGALRGLAAVGDGPCF